MVVAGQSVTHPLGITPLGLQYDNIDVAAATALCADLQVGSYTAQVTIKFQYDSGVWSIMPTCSNVEVFPVLPSVAGAAAAPATAICERPATSGAAGKLHRAEATLWISGVATLVVDSAAWQT